MTEPQDSVIRDGASDPESRADRHAPVGADSDDLRRSIDPSLHAEPAFCLIEILVDDDGVARNYRFVESSPEFDRRAGVQNAAGMTVRDIVPDLPDAWPAIFLEVSESQKSIRMFRDSAMDGKELQITAIPAGPPSSRRVAVVTVVTREKERVEADLRRAHTLLEGIAEGTDDLIAAEDPDFRYTYFNEAYAREFEKLWGHRLAPGESMIELLAGWPGERDKARDLWQRALGGESFRIEMEFGPDAEHTRTYDLRFSPLRDPTGLVIGAAHIFRDVTDRVATEEALRTADRRKDEFLAMLGHELRNPLAAMQHATALIKHLHGGDERLARATDILDRQSTHMGRLIEGLLEVSRVASGKITLEPQSLDLCEVVAEVVADRGGQIVESGVSVAQSGARRGVGVVADRVRLAQIIDNLLSNAVKFTPAGGHVSIEVRSREGHAEMRMRDSGVGIAEGRTEQMFEAFHQETDDVARGAGGLGLGLALARGLAELHRGTLQGYSEGLGKGSEFVLRLPLREGDPPRSSSDGIPVGRAHFRVLLVEDNVDAADMLSALLRERGHATTHVESGPEAFDVLREGETQVVVCDIGLPEMDGYAVARRIRANETWNEIVLIALTGYGQASDRDRASAAGFDAHLTKPVTVKQLEDTIQRLNPRPTPRPDV